MFYVTDDLISQRALYGFSAVGSSRRPEKKTGVYGDKVEDDNVVEIIIIYYRINVEFATADKNVCLPTRSCRAAKHIIIVLHNYIQFVRRLSR